MTIYRREGSQYWWIRLERRGHVIQQSSGTNLKREAKLKEAELRLQHWPELEGGTAIPTLVDFSRELFAFWKRELKPNTRKYYLDGFKQLYGFEELASARLDEITPKLLERYKEKRRNDGVGLVTVQHSLRALRRALKIAVEVFGHKFTPVGIRLRKEPQRDFVVTEADFQRFLAHAGWREESVADFTVREGAGRQTMQAILTVLYDCGLRAGEACRLEWSRVNLDERWLFIDSGKTKAARRRVPLTSRVIAVLSGLKEKARPDVPFVFTRYGGHQPITTGVVSHAFLRIRRQLGLPDGCVLHSLRHSFATRLGNAGANTGDLMKLAGWETASIAVRYTHLDNDRMRQIVGLLEENYSNTTLVPRLAGK
jgi:integrase